MSMPTAPQSSIMILAASILAASILVGCGGGGSSSSGGNPAAQPPTISGVAAVGAPLGGTLALEDSAGALKQVAVSAADGKFSVDITGMAAPFFLKFTDDSGMLALYSIAVQAGTANVNPLSGAVVVQAAANVDAAVADPATVFANPGKFKSISAAQLKGAAASVMAGLSPGIRNDLLKYASAGVDPVSDVYTLGSGLDKLFDDVSIELDGAKTFMYQIQGLDSPGAIDKLAASAYSMLIVDPVYMNKGQENFDARGMVQKLKITPNGPPRIVLAYIDIGEAENYRSYWQSNWVAASANAPGNPSFIVTVDPDGWSGNFPVAFWAPQWQALWLGDNGFVAQLAKLGFSGVYLDWVEAYLDPKVAAAAQQAGIDPALEMMKFIEAIRSSGRKFRPDFQVVAQNAAYLLDKDPARYLKTIDGLGVEDTWFGGIADSKWGTAGGGDIPNKYADEHGTQAKVAQFQKYLAAGKPVFTIDYCLRPENAAAVYAAAKSAGVRPLVSQVELSQITATPPQ